jgi:hypothetical protein
MNKVSANAAATARWTEYFSLRQAGAPESQQLDAYDRYKSAQAHADTLPEESAVNAIRALQIQKCTHPECVGGKHTEEDGHETTSGQRFRVVNWQRIFIPTR